MEISVVIFFKQDLLVSS